MAEEQQKPLINYVELTLKQVEAVEYAADRLKASPGEKSNRQLEIELEKLCFYQTSARGKPNIRAKQAAERARTSVLGRVIMQRPVKQ